MIFLPLAPASIFAVGNLLNLLSMKSSQHAGRMKYVLPLEGEIRYDYPICPICGYVCCTLHPSGTTSKYSSVPVASTGTEVSTTSLASGMATNGSSATIHTPHGITAAKKKKIHHQDMDALAKASESVQDQLHAEVVDQPLLNDPYDLECSEKDYYEGSDSPISSAMSSASNCSSNILVESSSCSNSSPLPRTLQR